MKQPSGKIKLLIPKLESDVLVRFHDGTLIAAGRDASWTERVARALSAGSTGQVKVVHKPEYTAIRARFDGPHGRTGELVVRRREDGRFKVVPHRDTTEALVLACAEKLGVSGSVHGETRRGHLVARGSLNGSLIGTASAPVERPLAADGESTIKLVSASSAHQPRMTGGEAIEKLGQKVVLSFLEGGTKVRMIGRKADCEDLAKRIIAGSPTLSTPKGAKHQIEGNLKRTFSEKVAGTGEPDAQGVRTRDDPKERAFSSFGDELTSVVAAVEANCKPGTVFTVVVGTRIISSGARLAR